jgi:hypothetical protein
VGIPPLIGVAVNVTLAPGHIAPTGFAAIVTLTGKFGLTVMVIVFEVAGLPVAQIAFEVSIHVTKSVFANVVLVYVSLLLPTFAPFSCH